MSIRIFPGKFPDRNNLMLRICVLVMIPGVCIRKYRESWFPLISNTLVTHCLIPWYSICVYLGGSFILLRMFHIIMGISVYSSIGCIRCSNPSSSPGESSRSSWQRSYFHSLWISHKQPLSPSPSPSSDLFCLDTLLASGLYKHSLSIAGSVEMCRGGSLCMTFVRCPQVMDG